MTHVDGLINRIRGAGRSAVLSLVVVLGVATEPATAAMTIYLDQGAWLETVTDEVIINFNEFPHGTTITNQYAPLGVTFENNPTIVNWSLFETDGFGLNAGFPPLGPPYPFVMEFSTPIHAYASVFPGNSRYWLYMDGVLVGDTGYYNEVPFLGIVSDLAFNRVVMHGTGANNMDTLFFGEFVPAPGVGVLFAFTGLMPNRRRRRG